MHMYCMHVHVHVHTCIYTGTMSCSPYMYTCTSLLLSVGLGDFGGSFTGLFQEGGGAAGGGNQEFSGGAGRGNSAAMG